MHSTPNSCHSCGMPSESGPYCQYCADEQGNLHGFEETVERMTQFWQRREPELGEQEARGRTLEHMANMPAWRDHPKLADRRQAKS